MIIVFSYIIIKCWCNFAYRSQSSASGTNKQFTEEYIRSQYSIQWTVEYTHLHKQPLIMSLTKKHIRLLSVSQHFNITPPKHTSSAAADLLDDLCPPASLDRPHIELILIQLSAILSPHTRSSSYTQLLCVKRLWLMEIMNESTSITVMWAAVWSNIKAGMWWERWALERTGARAASLTDIWHRLRLPGNWLTHANAICSLLEQLRLLFFTQ